VRDHLRSGNDATHLLVVGAHLCATTYGAATTRRCGRAQVRSYKGSQHRARHVDFVGAHPVRDKPTER